MFSKRMRLFRLLDFDVYVDASWLIIAFLIVWSLSGSLFPAQFPELGLMSYVLMGIVAAIGFFTSILVHEFCHALVARRFGMPMGGITLWMFGGVAEMTDEPPSAKAEFWMAIAGPIASLLIAVGCFAVYNVSGGMEGPISIAAIFGYLARINLILAIFNMIPAFPLDGGRVLRSVIWGWKGNLQKATQISSKTGSAFGFFLMALGVLVLLNGNPFGGFWYFLIGLFIRWAARTSYRQLLLKGSLQDRTVGDFSAAGPTAVPPDSTVQDFIENYVYRHQASLFPVIDDSGTLRGCVRVSQAKEVTSSQRGVIPVKNIMEPISKENCLCAQVPAFEALGRLARARDRKMVVKEGEQFVGVVSMEDIMYYATLRLELADDPSATLKTG